LIWQGPRTWLVLPFSVVNWQKFHLEKLVLLFYKLASSTFSWSPKFWCNVQMKNWFYTCKVEIVVKLLILKFPKIIKTELAIIILFYVIIKWMRTLWLVNQLWFIVPVNSWKFCVSSELLYKSNRPQVFMVYRLKNHLGCWKNTQRIRKLLACSSWFTNSSHVFKFDNVTWRKIT